VSERIGQGPWSRLLASSVVGDEGSGVAERGRVLARGGGVGELDVSAGTLAGVVEGHAVTISAARVPPRIWAAMKRYARGKPPLEAAVEGRGQSVHLEHLMTVDWEEPLVPPARALVRSCSCGRDRCEHVAALAYAVADELDRDPSLLLRFRGCDAEDEAPEPELEPEPAEVLADDDWRAGPLPPPRDLRPLPAGAVLKRLGQSGVRIGGDDLADVLERAYASFARHAERCTPRR
jgi:uncharacterized Zn finger protein